MKSKYLMIILSLLFVTSNYAQSTQQRGVITVENIGQVSKSQTNKTFDIAIQIATTDLNGFYVGALFYCLQIGKLAGIGESGPVFYKKKGKSIYMEGGGGGNTLVFRITEENWKTLKNGDPMFISYGCGTVTDFEKAKPFALLNKKLLKK
jgi:hypothetical protein